MVGQFLAYAVGAGMVGWMVWAVGASLYSYFADEVKEARRHGETTKSGIMSGMSGLFTCLVMSVVIIIAIIVVVGVGSFFWDILFGPRYGPEYEAWRY